MGSSTNHEVEIERTSSNTDVCSSSHMEEDSTKVDELPSGLIPAEMLSKLFRLDKQLGQGSFGKVYQATHIPNGENCVVKKIQKRTPEVRAMALREAQIGMGIEHPNVCKTYAYSEDEHYFYIIMEYIEGKDLYELIISEENIFQKKLSLFWFIVMNILHGLDAIHQKGIVHCDIKPENVKIGISPDGKTITSVKIIDFGLSRPIGKIQQWSAGTHDYMAPEVANGKSKDFSLDIWSLGILMYAMFMTGIPSQIHSRNRDDVLRKAEVIQNLSRLTTDGFKPFPHISKQLRYSRIQEFILSCLRVNRIERPTLQALLAKIDEFFHPSPIEKKDA
jgi:serine/threonine protein kinase